MGLFDNYKFHPSSLGKIMTNSRTKEPLGETCKTHLAECYVSHIYGREKEIFNKYVEKGLAVEEDAITLYSRVSKTFFKKNEEVIENDFFIGTPDLFLGKEIRKAEEIKDIKSSWDIFTFHSVMTKAINPLYEWQLQGYSDLSFAKKMGLVYVLVDTPDTLIQKEKNKLMWEMGSTTSESPLFLEACEKLEKEMIFSDIPIEKRYIEFKLERDQKAIDSAHKRVIECREFLNAIQ